MAVLNQFDPLAEWQRYLDGIRWGERGAGSTHNREAHIAILRGVSLGIDEKTIRSGVESRITGCGGVVVPRALDRSFEYALAHADPDPRTGKDRPPPKPEPAQREWVEAHSPEVVETPGQFLANVFNRGECVAYGTAEQTSGKSQLPLWQYGEEMYPVSHDGGVFFLCNPVDGSVKENTAGNPSNRSEGNVCNWRHVVLESDTLPPEEALRRLKSIPLPIVAIYTSGGRSIHALCRIDAPNKAAWDEVIKPRKAAFKGAGFDDNALSAVRLTRLPFCKRGGREQELLYLAGKNVNFVNIANPQPVPGDMWAAVDKWLAMYAVNDLDADLWHPEDEPDPRPPVMTWLERVPLRRGNLSQGSGKAKSGKSAFRDAMVSSFGNGTDCLGWESENAEGAVLLFDFEQSRDDFIESNRRIWRRAGMEKPDWFRAYRLRDYPQGERWKRVETAIERAKADFGSLRFIILDGGSDLVPNVNDPEASSEAVTKWMQWSTEYDCHLHVIVHGNEGHMSGNDARGHLGKELQRKSEATFVLEKTDADTTKVYTSRHRKGGVHQNEPFTFRWDDDQQMHVSAGFAADAKADAKRQELAQLAEDLFAAAEALSYSGAVAKLEELTGKATRTAKARLAKMREEGFVKVTQGTGLYSLSPSTAGVSGGLFS